MAQQLGPHTRIIYLASNPVGDKPLDFQAEADAIREEVEGDGAWLPLYVDPSATTDDLHETLLKAPGAQVLHLAGHGSAQLGLLSLDPDGQAVAIKGTDLARVLGTFPNIRLVVLSACRLMAHAEEIARIVPCVVATSEALGDRVARRFSRAFYKELAHGEAVDGAFERARTITGLDHGPGSNLELCSRTLINPRWIRILPAPSQLRPRARLAKEATELLDGYEDVVITNNVAAPIAEVLPLEENAEPEVIDLGLPAGAWHREWPANRDRWSQAIQAVTEGARRARGSGRRRIHVLANLPYSLGALLGSQLEQQDRSLSFYQESPMPGGAADQRQWQAWGPERPGQCLAPSTAPVFPNARLPETPVERTMDVGVLCHVSRNIDKALARRAIAAVDGQVQFVSLIPDEGTHAQSIDPHNIDRAVDDLASVLQDLPRAFPRARAVHLFYAGPLALLMRAAGRLRLSALPTYLYEWFPRTAEGPAYKRVLELGSCQLLLTGDER